ncbi:hypothetical protein ACFLRN_04075 [Thermoproteota archaeon]
MKAFTALILTSIIFSVSIIASPTLAYDEPSVGVKEGDWIEYDISVTGTGTSPPTHDVRWMRIEILPVQGAAFSVNLTTRYANGTMGTAVWKFNVTEGNVGGWIIIPSNLSPGDMFYDSSEHTGKPVNVTVQSQEQKTVLGASRTVTYGDDSFRHKEWDKATGVFVGSSEHFRNVTNKDGWYIEDLTVTIHAIATNMWNPDKFLGINQMVFYGLAAVILVLAVLILASLMIVTRTKKTEKLTLCPSLQGKLAVLTIIIVVLVEIGIILFFPFYEIGMSFAEFNLIMQTFWTGLVLVSMWFRKKGNYFVHEITMLVVMCAWFVGFSAVLFMGPLSSLEMYVGTTLRLVMNVLHAVFSIPALVFGTWLVTLWRPGSTSFATKSRRIAQLTTIFWVLSYLVGVLDGMLLHTTIFG